MAKQEKEAGSGDYSTEKGGYECPDCGSALSETDEHCPKCGAEFEDPSLFPSEGAGDEEINKEEPEKYSFNCPDCGQKLITTNEENILSKKVKCPKCDKIFNPSEDSEEIKEKPVKPKSMTLSPPPLPEEYQNLISQLSKMRDDGKALHR